jgi:hypothetical protein
LLELPRASLPEQLHETMHGRKTNPSRVNLMPANQKIDELLHSFTGKPPETAAPAQS